MQSRFMSYMDELRGIMAKYGTDNLTSTRGLSLSSRGSGASLTYSTSTKQSSKLLSPTSNNLIEKKPKVMQRYLSIVLKGNGDRKSDQTSGKEKPVQISRKVPKQKPFTVATNFTENFQNNPLAMNLSRHHIQKQVQVILQTNMRERGNNPPKHINRSEVQTVNKSKRGSGRKSSKSDSQFSKAGRKSSFTSENQSNNIDSKSLHDVARSPRYTLQTVVQVEKNSHAMLADRGNLHSEQSPDSEEEIEEENKAVEEMQQLDHEPIEDAVEKGESKPGQECIITGNKEIDRAMEKYFRSKNVTTLSSGVYPELIMAPPGEKRVIHYPIGLSPEEAQQYIRLLIKAKRGGKCATTTPTAPYSSTDLIGSYNNDTNQFQDDLRIGNGLSHGGLDTDRSERRRSRDIGSDRRPPSRKDSKKTIVISTRESKTHSGVDSSNDRQRDSDLTTTGIASVTGGGLSQKNYFKPLASRNSFVRNSITSPTPRPSTNGPAQSTEAVPAQRTTPLTARESEDTLVAMGTNWNPNNAFQRSNGRQGSFSNGNGNHGYHLAHQLSISQAPTTMTRQLSKRNTVPHLSSSRPSIKDCEPKYGDPTIGAPASFQQRLIEMSALESETIRWERTRKFQKKKPRSET